MTNSRSLPNDPNQISKFLVTDLVPAGCIESLEQLGFEVDYIEDLSNGQLKAVISKYTGIVVRTSIILNKEMLDLATNLKYIIRPGSGLDNIDVEYAEKKGIKLFNSPEANSDAVAEHAIGLLLGLLNFIPKADSEVRKGEWIRKQNTGFILKGKTIGIIGYGHTGSAFAQKLSGFQVRILVYDKYKNGFGPEGIQESDMKGIFEEADVVSIHLPLTPETKYLVNESFITNFKKPIILINTSRGKIADTAALISGLKSGKILGAGLNVLENEKLSTYDSEENRKIKDLFNAGNVIITPHIAGWTKESREEIFNVALSKFMEFLGKDQKTG